jgi:hypothetical protein
LYLDHISEEAEILDRLPIRELKPNAVFVLCGQEKVVAAIRSARLDVQIVRACDQLGYGSKFPDELRWDEWRPHDVARFLDLGIDKSERLATEIACINP